MITLVLPYPVSSNRYWATRVIKSKQTGKPMALTYVTSEAVDYRKAVALIARASGVHAPLACRVALEIDLYPHRPQDWQRRMRVDPLTWDDTVQCIDLGNAEKVLADALQGIVFDDDKRIWREVKRRMEPDGEGRVVVRISPLVIANPQATLVDEPARPMFATEPIPF